MAEPLPKALTDPRGRMLTELVAEMANTVKCVASVEYDELRRCWRLRLEQGSIWAAVEVEDYVLALYRGPIEAIAAEVVAKLVVRFFDELREHPYVARS